MSVLRDAPHFGHVFVPVVASKAVQWLIASILQHHEGSTRPHTIELSSLAKTGYNTIQHNRRKLDTEMKYMSLSHALITHPKLLRNPGQSGLAVIMVDIVEQLSSEQSPLLEAVPILLFPGFSRRGCPQFLRRVSLPYPKVGIIAARHDKPDSLPQGARVHQREKSRMACISYFTHTWVF